MRAWVSVWKLVWVLIGVGVYVKVGVGVGVVSVPLSAHLQRLNGFLYAGFLRNCIGFHCIMLIH